MLYMNMNNLKGTLSVNKYSFYNYFHFLKLYVLITLLKGDSMSIESNKDQDFILYLFHFNINTFLLYAKLYWSTMDINHTQTKN